MSLARVLVAVAFATVLLVAAFFVLRRPGAVLDTPVALLRFDPAKAVGLTVTRPDGSREAVKRGDAAGEWMIEVVRGGVTSVWPAASGNVRAAFRLLAQIEGSRRAETGSALGPDTTLVEVGVEDGQRVSMRIDGRVLAGKVLAQTELPIKSAPAWIDASFADMLVKAGPREWRDARVLPEMAEASRITLVSGATTIGLARVQGRWGVREPVVEAAEPEAITRLAGGLASTQIVDYLDGGGPAAGQTGLDAPAASVTIEIDRRDPATGQSAPVVTTLKIGQPSDMSGKGVFAALVRPGQPERVVVVSAESLAGLSRDPAAYIARRAVSTPAADVGSVVIGGETGRRFARSIDGWRVVRGGGQEPLPATVPDASELDALLKLLTDTRADTVVLDPSPASGAASVELKSIGDAPVGMVSVSLDSDPATHKPVVLVRSESVVRRYGGSEAAATYQWMAGR